VLFRSRISWFWQRWRTQRNAIRNANCRIQWIIKFSNADCALGLSWEHASSSASKCIGAVASSWKPNGKKANSQHSPQFFVGESPQSNKCLVGCLVVCFFPVSYVVPLLRRWGKLGLLLNGRQAFIARGISPVEYSCYFYIFSRGTMKNNLQKLTERRNSVWFFLFLLSDLSHFYRLFSTLFCEGIFRPWTPKPEILARVRMGGDLQCDCMSV